jgi:predicted RNase H-like HicB family nuclease
LLWSDEDLACLARVPELPGCMADGPTPEDAVKNLRVIVDEWIETARSLNRNIPEPVDVAKAQEWEATFRRQLVAALEKAAAKTIKSQSKQLFESSLFLHPKNR